MDTLRPAPRTDDEEGRLFRVLLHSKIHRATVTDVSLHYEGSISIDEALLEAAAIVAFERVDVYDIDNGARFSTYAIPEPAASGTVRVNGAAARLVQPGDKIIIVSYVTVDEAQIHDHVPRVVLLDRRNRVASIGNGSSGVLLIQDREDG